ncbi:MAG: DUF2288 domain-containing protein [Coleofasciculaceae cyanobacterium SM2_3_26]|nr:DUF2288 domain-containing protein [Coleofasciculaceae cyanobacterium SM2_3_26]
MEELKANLSQEVDEAQWAWLMPHAKRDAVVLVDARLDLVEVGAAIASDNVPSVQRWIGEQLIHKPSEDCLSDWNAQPEKKFRALIVSPYVLVQEV